VCVSPSNSLDKMEYLDRAVQPRSICVSQATMSNRGVECKNFSKRILYRVARERDSCL
jgi:hypothetical protein